MRLEIEKHKPKGHIAGIVLAAGIAARMGIPKQLLPYKESTLLAHVVGNASRSTVAPLIVVLGHAADDIRRRVDFGAARVVVAEKYADGQSESLKAGLSIVPSCCDGALFILGDQPLIPPSVMDDIADAFYRSEADIVVPTYDGKRGNPVLFGRNLFSSLNRLSGDTGGRSLLKTFPDRVMEIALGSESICFDVDTRKDYQQLLRK